MYPSRAKKNSFLIPLLWASCNILYTKGTYNGAIKSTAKRCLGVLGNESLIALEMPAKCWFTKNPG